jgi:DDE superfamily endonuclease
MEHILQLYHQPYQSHRPLICFDEKSIQLLAHLRDPLPVEPTKPRREDYEYKRQGTRNLFIFVEPKAGQRHLLLTQHRTKVDFAQVMRYLVDVLYPEVEQIDLVLDNLNTHHYHSLVETFGKAEADRIASRLCFHFTPAHASWLNMAEIELSVLSQQCLKQRFPDEWTLTMELLAWEQTSNTLARQIHWSFTVEDAKSVFAKYYSVFLNS